MIAGASTSAKSRIAASPPSPSSVIVAPASLGQLLRRPRTVERHRVQAQAVAGVARARPGRPARSRRCSGASRWGRRRAGPSHLPAAGERAAQRHLVGVLEVAADREPAREPGHAAAAAQAVGQVRGGGLARSSWGSSRGAPRRPRRPRPAGAARRSAGARGRRRRSARGRRPARGRGRGTRASARARSRPTDPRRRRSARVPARVGADRAPLVLGEVEAVRAGPDPLLDLTDRVGRAHSRRPVTP